LMTGGLADSYEESPRQKVATSQQEEDQNDQDPYEDEDYDNDEDNEAIDCAERIFIRVADELIKKNTTVRRIF
jgi:hypothetical protein